MLFNKKKNKMIDVRELHKKGIVNLSKKQSNVPTNNEGFVELTPKTANTPQHSAIEGTPNNENQSNANFFGFMNGSDTPSHSNSEDSYTKREVDQKTTDLDNKIYKLEQRIELLEKKLNINQSTNNSGVIGW